jgi:hypothetical protein|tara:strand:+ start:2465 stop:3106 length:642 start_codon:yes stop_codon:yes gene_type:complete
MATQEKVCIVQDEMGGIIRISKNNSDYGHVRLTQEAVTYTATGWVKKQVRSTLLHGLVEDLKVTNIHKKKSLPGLIYIIEQFTPFTKDNPNRDLKQAGKTMIICKGTDIETGEVDCPIYRKSFYDPTGTMQDTLIAHTNSKEIRVANSDDVMSLLKESVDETKVVASNQIDLEDSIEEISNEVEDSEEIIEDVEESTEEVLVEEEEEEVSFNL